MSTKIILCSVNEIDLGHNNTPMFTNVENQYSWFLNRSIKIIEENSYIKKNDTYNIEYNVDELRSYNYIIVNNKNKYYYYFVIDREYVNEELTRVYTKLDVIQTYLFDFKIETSLIDRQHVNEYNLVGELMPNYCLEDEGLELGEYIEVNRTTVYDYTNKGSYIISSSDRLGVVKGGGSSGGDGQEPINSKRISEKMLVSIKALEGFSSIPYNNNDGTLTIGYGITSVHQPEYWSQLYPKCTEKQASEVLGNMLLYKFSSIVYDQFVKDGLDIKTLKQQELDAYVSYAMNSGFWGKTGLFNTDIYKFYLQGKSNSLIADIWKTTNIMQGTEFEQGLRYRRNEESNIFLNAIYPSKMISNLSEGGYITDNDNKGYIPPEYCEGSTNNIRDKIVASAKKLIGKPYIWGGNYPPLGNDIGTDCSGLMQWAYNDNGIKISRTTYTQIKEGKQITMDQLQKGDLIFNYFIDGSPEHVIMYSGFRDGVHYIVEAQQPGVPILEREFYLKPEFHYRSLI